MSTLYLLRHGQPGPRHDYDQLSPLGHTQTRLLGTHLAALPAAFQYAVSGTLRRQRESAANALSQFSSPPVLRTDARWNEFDFFHLYDELLPALRESDERFRDPETSQDLLDNVVMRAWLTGQCQYSGESWSAFSQRIAEVFDDTAAALSNGPILVFTSAAPTALALGRALQLPGPEVNRLAGSIRHAAVNAIARVGGAWLLRHDNETLHLASDPLLQTHR